MGRPAGCRDEGQPGPSYGPIRGVAAAVARTLFGLWKKLSFLLRVALPIYLSLRRVYLSAGLMFLLHMLLTTFYTRVQFYSQYISV